MRDLRGERFGKLTAIEPAGRSYRGNAVWCCICDCGGTAEVPSNNLRSGNSKSCGCAKAPRRGPRMLCTRTYKSWASMMQRCTNPNHVWFRRYGGRGITVSERWREYANFLADMGLRPAGKSLDRIDNSQGYCAENCRWATAKEQATNRDRKVVASTRE